MAKLLVCALICNGSFPQVADYGLSRTMAIGVQSNEAYYRMKTSKPLPIRWMVRDHLWGALSSSKRSVPLQAPSSILDAKFDSSTDVWSFGCVCVEIWSQGQVRSSKLRKRQAKGRLLTCVLLPDAIC